jgi:transcription initiation factor TFIIIB Brf1 subunit/transcription initiation factor TFIIB
MPIIYIEYELCCSCGCVKHTNSFVSLFEWYLEHDPDRKHSIKVLHFLNNKVRVMSDFQIEKDIEYVMSEEKEEHERKYPFGAFNPSTKLNNR